MNKRQKEVTIQDTILYERITIIEAKILQKLLCIKKEKLNFCCKHFENLDPICELYDPNINYYDKFWKLYLLNQLFIDKIQKSSTVMNQYEEKVIAVERLFEEHEELLNGKVSKKIRRQADQVERNHRCPYPDCFKAYGTEISLNLHIKLKHNGGNKREREKAAEMALIAEQNNEPMPNFQINLPPGYLQEYRQNQSRKNSSHLNSLQEPDLSLSKDRDRQKK